DATCTSARRRRWSAPSTRPRYCADRIRRAGTGPTRAWSRTWWWPGRPLRRRRRDDQGRSEIRRAGGCFTLEPTVPYQVERRYLPGTNVLETTFSTRRGVVRVLDSLNQGAN